MGYVAHYQQFDPEATHAGPDAPGRHEASYGPDQFTPHPDEAHPRQYAVQPDQYAAQPDQYEMPTDQYVAQTDQYAAYPDQYAADADQYETYDDRRTVYADQYEIHTDPLAVDHQQAYPDRYGTYPDQYQAYPYPPADDATAVFAGPGDRLIDLSAPRQAPVEHRRPGRMRTGVLAVAALAVMLAGGTGYVLLRGTDSDNSAAASVRRSTDASAPPSAQPGDSTVPNGEPVHTAPTSPAATTTPPPATVAVTAPAVVSLIPVPVPAQPVRTTAPVKTTAPAPTTPAPTSGSPSASTPATPPTAAYSYRTDDDDADPITGYLGTITITNPGDTPADPGTVALTVPPGTTATIKTGEATTTRDGSTVTFHAGTIAAHSSTTFTFTLTDPLTALPTTCTLNNTPCN